MIGQLAGFAMVVLKYVAFSGKARPDAQLLSEQISYIGYPTITDAKFIPSFNNLSMALFARISNSLGLYSTNILGISERPI
jgi:hypothetical protein